MIQTYQNLFLSIGLSEEAVNDRIKDCFDHIFYQDETKFYYEKESDEAYLLDTGNEDARTEGISYGMMMAVQMNQQDIFDRLWRFAERNMLMVEGKHAGYFAWSVGRDGHKNAYGPAPDGEEYFAMALFFAENRWGGRQAPYDYGNQARTILRHCIHQKEMVAEGYTMWDLDNHQIKFIPEANYTDPSYHLPHYYALFAKEADEGDRPFWEEASQASVAFLQKVPHPETGMVAEYTEYDGSPKRLFRDPEFYSDAYRVAMNMGLDALWFNRKGYSQHITNLQYFFSGLDMEAYSSYLVDGTDLHEKAMHPVAIVATNAAGCLALDHLDEDALYWIRKFWNTPMRLGPRRYYDNCLYFFSLLMLAGKYKMY